ncbi:hypothetical protein SEPCBS57363_004222 [Sporothrix epigloea]|uniref:Vps72/YL1 C-terminal domain-containing protein n=1 Tax=Sporothrix epigloea TaxID=1892477 RepID=A0ABP0DS42_9PEZI
MAIDVGDAAVVAEMKNLESPSNLSILSDSDDSESGKSESDSRPRKIEWLATGRAKRATAGNRMKSLIASVAASSDQLGSGAGVGDDADDLELLFAEDGEDGGWSLDEDQDGSDDDVGEVVSDGDVGADDDGGNDRERGINTKRRRRAARHGDEDDEDMHMDSSDDDDEDDREGGAGADELAGERELESKEHEKRKTARKRKAQAAIPARFRKKVRIVQSQRPTRGLDESTPTRTTTPAPQAYQPPPPRKKKKSERASWLPTAAEAPIRASSRATTRISKEQLYQQMAERERRRERQLLIMAKKQARDEANKKPPLTQAQRLAEAAIAEEVNSRSLNKWEEAEKQREAERAAKLAAMYNRTLEGPVVTFWSGIVELTGDGLLQSHMGRMVAMEEKAPRKKRLTAAEKAAAAEQAAVQEAAPEQNDKEGKQKGEDSSLVDLKQEQVTRAVGEIPKETEAKLEEPSAKPQEGTTHSTDASMTQLQVPGVTFPAPGDLQSSANPLSAPVDAHVDGEPATIGRTAPVSVPLNHGTPYTESTNDVPASAALGQRAVPELTAPDFTTSNVVAEKAPEATEVAMNDVPPSAEKQPSAAEPFHISIAAAPVTSAPPSDKQASLSEEQTQSSVLPVAIPSASASVHAPRLADNSMPPPPLPYFTNAITAPLLTAVQERLITVESLGTSESSATAAPSNSLVPVAGVVISGDSDAQNPDLAKTAANLTHKAKVEEATADGTRVDTASALPADSRVTRSCIVLQNFDEDAVEDKQVQMQVLFGRRMSKIAKPSHAPLCSITGHRSRYRDVGTGLPFYNAFAYKQIRKLCKGEMRWSSLVGAWVGTGTLTPAAAGVPVGFVDPTKVKKTTAAERGVANDKGGAEVVEKELDTGKGKVEEAQIEGNASAETAADKPNVELAEAQPSAPSSLMAPDARPVSQAIPSDKEGHLGTISATLVQDSPQDVPMPDASAAAAATDDPGEPGKAVLAPVPAPDTPQTNEPAASMATIKASASTETTTATGATGFLVVELEPAISSTS